MIFNLSLSNMYAKISDKHFQGKNVFQHALDNRYLTPVYCGSGQGWTSSIIILHQQCLLVNKGGYYKEIEMYLPGPSRGF